MLVVAEAIRYLKFRYRSFFLQGVCAQDHTYVLKVCTLLACPRRAPALSREVRANVDPTAIILTDDWPAYKPLKGEFLDHKVINHSAGLYVDGDVHTNYIEGAFGNLKTGMRGVYKKVSPRYLQSYLDEYAWRHNARRSGDALFARLRSRGKVSE